VAAGRRLVSPALPRARQQGATPLQAGVALGVSLLAGAALVASPDWWIAFGLVGVAGLVALGLAKPALFLSIFLLVRPLLDQFSQSTVGVPSANVAGALGAFLVAITIVVLALRQQRVSVPGTAPLLAITIVSVILAVEANFEVGSVMGTRSISELVRLIALVAVFLLAAHVTTSVSKARLMYVVIVLSAIGPAGYGIYELIHGVPVEEGDDIARISGTFTGPVPFGAFMAFTALVCIFGPVQKLPGWVRWPALALMLVALLESYSRVGWVIFILGLLILAWPRQKRLVVVALVGFAIALMVSHDVRERALPVDSAAQSSDTPGGEAGYESYDWRLANWGGLLDKAAERPLLGYGLKTTEFVNPRAPTSDFNAAAGSGFGAHNTFVRVMVEGGVVLLLIYLAFFALVMRRTWRLSRADWPLAEPARLVLVVWGLVLFTGATTDDPFSLTALMVGLLALTGALEGAWRAQGRSLEQAVPVRAEGGAPSPFWRPAAPGGAPSG